MYGPMLQRWNMLAIDNRGTGQSTPLRCPELQDFTGPTGSSAFQSVVGECGEALDHRWKYPGGARVRASDLFGTASAVQDMAAVLHALALARVDLYGDSYGSFFAQAFAARYPQLMRSLVLDSSYQPLALDPLYRSTIASMPADLQAVCARSAACAAAGGETAWARIGALVTSLRANPISAVVPGPTGKRERVTMTAGGLVDLVGDSAEDPQIYRDLDAATGALLDEFDPAPLLRLYAQRLADDETYFGLPTGEYSVGLYFADACTDYPQLFDMGASPGARTIELRAALAALAPVTYSPFTIAEWLAQDENTEAFSGCLDWPAPASPQPPVTGRAPLLPESLPVLALGGELDTWTPPVDAPKVLSEIGGHARFVELANSTHVVGEGATVCGSTLVREFVAAPQDVDTLDASCALAVPAIHAVGVYPSQLATQPPLAPSPGSAAPVSDLRLAAAAVDTAGDAIARAQSIESSSDHGLHGGAVTARNGAGALTLERDQLVPGVVVSGTVALSPAPSAVDGDAVVATLTASAPGLGHASFTAAWTTAGQAAIAQVQGSVAGLAVVGTMPAP
jgi:pimeloyl-ACP methyl ester carboxylesterase